MPIFDDHGNYVKSIEPKDEFFVHQERNRLWAVDPEFQILANWFFTCTIIAGETYRLNSWTQFLGVGPLRFKFTSPSSTITVTSFTLGRTLFDHGTPAAQYIRDGRTLTLLADGQAVDITDGPNAEGMRLARLAPIWRDSDLEKGLRFSVSRSDKLEPIDYALMVLFSSFGLRTKENRLRPDGPLSFFRPPFE